MPKDFLGQELQSGDVVAIMRVGYRDFVKGILISNSPTKVGKVKFSNHKYDDPSNQKYSQMIKITDPKIVFEVNRDLS
jgi:hypothetical protein